MAKEYLYKAYGSKLAALNKRRKKKRNTMKKAMLSAAIIITVAAAVILIIAQFGKNQMNWSAHGDMMSIRNMFLKRTVQANYLPMM